MFHLPFPAGRAKFWGLTLAILLVIALLLSLTLFPSLLPGRQKPSRAAETSTSGQSLQPTTATTPTASLSYHTSGKTILDNRNQPYVPYGVFLGGILLANTNWQQNGATTYITQAAIQAAHDYWFANMVSLQVAYEPLFPQGSHAPMDSAYLAMIDQVVSQANALGMNVSLVLQEEAIYGFQNQAVILPTSDALTFWDALSKHFAQNQRVFFDLFNEPDTTYLSEPPGVNANTCPTGSASQAITWDDACAWSYWKNGTTQDGVTYYGMNQIARKIRANGAQNLIFAQGLANSEDLALLANTYTAEQGQEFLLTVPNVVYAIHPYFGPTHDTQSQWDQWFGTAVANGHFPVLASEWGLNQEKGSGCEASSKLQIPQVSVFLAYLRARNIGLVGWALQTGELIRNWNFRDPTTFTSQTMPADCDVPPFSTDPQAQGVGQILQQFFSAYSQQYATP